MRFSHNLAGKDVGEKTIADGFNSITISRVNKTHSIFEEGFRVCNNYEFMKMIKNDMTSFD